MRGFAKGSKHARLKRGQIHRQAARNTKDGYKLEGERLSHGKLWYRYQEDAISYAKWNSRANGCKIDILCDQNKVIRTEEFSPEIVML